MLKQLRSLFSVSNLCLKYFFSCLMCSYFNLTKVFLFHNIQSKTRAYFLWKFFEIENNFFFCFMQLTEHSFLLKINFFFPTPKITCFSEILDRLCAFVRSRKKRFQPFWWRFPQGLRPSSEEEILETLMKKVADDHPSHF